MIWLMGDNFRTVAANWQYPTTLANTSLAFELSFKMAVIALRQLQHNCSNALLSSCVNTIFYCITQTHNQIYNIHRDKNDFTSFFCWELVWAMVAIDDMMLVKHLALISCSCSRRLLWLLWSVIIDIVSTTEQGKSIIWLRGFKETQAHPVTSTLAQYQ